ncbi:hypothetical protein GINT2_001802 [Glugoides intestinalis]
MVRLKQKKSTVLSASINSQRKNFIGPAFYSSLTVHPLNLDKIPDSYVFPMVYLFLLSAVSITLSAFRVVYTGTMQESVLKLILSALFTIPIVFGVFAFICFVISYIGAKITGIEHSSKQFGLNASSFTYVPIAMLLTMLLPEHFAGIIVFGISFLAIYYLESTYSRYFPYATSRESVIHHVYIFITYFTASYIFIGFPLKAYIFILKIE